MSLINFIPTIWSARLLENLRTTLVYAQPNIINREYEGEIQAKGDTVKINSIGPVTVGDYTKNADIAAPETLSDAQQTLTITEQKFFNFQVDDIDRAQQNPKIMDAAMGEAAYAMARIVDTYVSAYFSGALAANLVGDDTTPVVPTATTAYETLVDLSVRLDEADIPPAGRYVVVPPWFHGLMLKDDRFVKVSGYGSNVILLNGEVGQAAGFRVLKSNAVPNTIGAKYKIMAGHPTAITFANQVNKVEGYRPEKRFADAVKGLHLYGSSLIRPSAIAIATCSKT